MGGAGMREMRNVYSVLVRNLKGRDDSQDLGIDGKVILEWIFEK